VAKCNLFLRLKDNIKDNIKAPSACHMTCYIKNPVSCFTNLWLWKVDDALTPGKESGEEHHHNVMGSANVLVATESAPTPVSLTGWSVGGDDVLILATFALVLLTSWLLRAWLVSNAYNGVMPKVWRGAHPMSLGSAFALVGLIVLILR
jgi:hypothetical protein